MEYNTIEEKVAALPIVPFDNSETFQQVLFSPLFDDIFHYYMDNYSTDRIKAQSELNQRLSLYLHITNQDEELAQNINDLIYRRPCPTIEEFLDNPFYMGNISGTIYPYWRKKLCEIFNPEKPMKKVLFGGATGTGKGLLLDEIIPTPVGYTKVKDLKVNDYLWGKNGKPTKILKIFDRGLQPIYKVHFDDNTTVTCDSNHLWEIVDYSKNKTIIRDTTWLATHKLHKNSRKDNSGKLLKYGINYCQPVEYSQKEYLVSPYLLGILLGDGHIGETINISNHIKDIEIINKCTSLLPMEYTFSSRETSKDVYQYNIIRKDKSNISYKKYIEDLGLSNQNSNTKFIPEEYKLGSIEQRLELLRGLMDTDGSISIKKSTNSPNRITFGTVSEQLANDVAELVRSLGGRAKIASQDRRQIKASCNFIEYEVRIWLELNPFSLKRKADLFIPRLIKKKIVSVEKAGENKTRCFVVDAEDHLFLCNDYIVTHNSRTAEKACVYALYRLLCLRYPRQILKVEAQSTLAMFILSVTQKTAYQVLFQPFIELLSNMPCFQRVRQARAFENFDLNNPKVPIPWYVDKSNMTIIFPDNIILTLGSQISNTVGYDILISECDEMNEKGTEEGMELINSIDGRVDGRFMGSPFTFQAVMSSARAKNSVTSEYNKKWKHDPKFLYLRPMRFEVKTSEEFTGTGEYFYVMAGNGSIPSKIITDPGEIAQLKKYEDETNDHRLGLLDYDLVSGCEIARVPEIYKPSFEADLDQSIQDILGISTQDHGIVFRDTTQLEDSLLVPELTIEANLKENTNIFNCLPLEQIFVKDGLKDEWRLKRYPQAPRYMHFDLSSSGECDTGICMLHKEYKINEITKEKEVIFVVDFIIYVTAKNMTDLEAVQNFAMELVTRGHIPIHTISCDQFQSQTTLNTWEQCGYFNKVEKVSVDTKLDPYLNAAALIENGKVKVGQCEKLKKELEALIIDKGKVTRTTQLKDGCDVLVGGIYNAQMNYHDVPQNEYYNKIKYEKEIDYNRFIDTEQEELIDL